MKAYDQGEYVLQRTSLGWVGAATSKKGLAAVVLPQREVADVVARLHSEFYSLREMENQLLKGFRGECEKYFMGQKAVFDELDIDWSWPTPFSLEVYRYVKDIPYGELMTYKEVAVGIGNSKAARAVGGAMKRNKLPLVIPCHRVISAKGLGGFTGAGLEIKEKMINMEKGLTVSA